MDRTRISRELELKFKGKKLMGQLRRRWLSQVLEDIQKRGKSRHATEKKKDWGKEQWKTFCPLGYI
jgi:hypothetical protein